MVERFLGIVAIYSFFSKDFVAISATPAGLIVSAYGLDPHIITFTPEGGFMTSKKCPDCGCQRFYVKDPEDQYNLFEFDWIDGEILPIEDESASESLDVIDETETYCDRCAWHDKFKTLK